MTKKLLLAALLVAASAFAQEPQEAPAKPEPPPPNRYTPLPPIPLGDILLSLPTSHIPAKGAWELRFTHRFSQSLDQGNGSQRIHSLFGLDSSADVGIGLSYTFRPRLVASVLRTNTLGDIEGAVKYVVLQEAQAIPFSLALRGGADWRTALGIVDRTSFFAQAILSKQIAGRAEVYAVPTFATNAGRAVTTASTTALFKHAFNVPVGAAVTIQDGLSLVGELIPVNRDLPKDVHAQLGWAIGLKRAIGLHYFEILVTNSNATHVDQYITSTYLGSPLRRGDLHLGFNIERRWGK
jgi:hypothetical protein